MKRFYFLAILANLLFSIEAFAQDVILQDTAAWEAKYYFASSGGEGPADNWYEETYPDSTWGTITGPIWRSNWEYYSTYWLRRHFVVTDISKFGDGDFRYFYDCDGVAYLNGRKISELRGSYGSWNTITLTPSVLEAVHEGDNVLAVRATDNGGDSFINFGLYLWEEPRKYSELHIAVDSLQHSLEGDTSNALPLTVVEATKLLERVQTAMASCEYDNNGAEEMTRIIYSMINRLNYQPIYISVNVPGAMGDSILSKVENFSDVISLKLSGTLNDADITTIQSRLMNLCEIDMTDVNMPNLPNRLFYQHQVLQKVFLPKDIITIGEYAFYQCYAINYIEFPATLTTINRYAFSECDNLQEVILPEELSTLGVGAFYSCDNNKYVKLPSTLVALDAYTFYDNFSLSKVDFGIGLTHIYAYAFCNCRSLKKLKFPSTLYYIGNDAFTNNFALSDIEFNEGLFQIVDNAFVNCDALTEVTLPSSLVRADASPFDYCDNLRKVTCLSIEPPYMTDQIPYGLSMEGRELYVPALSINVYKQTTGWDRFPTIKPIDYLPENITVRGNLKLTLPDSIPSSYKPNVSIIWGADPNYNYGSLTVNGKGVLSMSRFTMLWDSYCQYEQYNRNLNYCSLLNNSHLRADNVDINIDMRHNNWTFISLPFDVSVSEIQTTTSGATNWIIRKYDGQKRALGETSETWVKMNTDDILHSGEGYIIQGSCNVGNDGRNWSRYNMNAVNNTNKNNIFRTTDVIVTLNEYESEFAHNRSWNLIGNPYPCYYDTRFMDFEAPITVWNMRSSTYEAYSPSDDSYILCPGEAFFVQRPVANGNIVFSKDGRQTNRDVRALESNARANIVSRNTATRTIINLSISNSNSTDHTRIVLNDQATMQYELDKDASKFMSTDASVPQIYTTSNGVNYAINERPAADGFANLCVYIGSDDFFTITLDNEVDGCQVVLEDKVEGKKVVLTKEAGYTFLAKGGTYTNRFVLHFIDETMGIKEFISDIQNNGAIFTTEGIRTMSQSKKGIYIQNGKKIMLNK
ncbi:MAG: leucine-rich repeat domain-containing protein [Prevotella sp.]|nr:leucine-rich repeat domain-containing protein [Prevotella sp.]